MPSLSQSISNYIRDYLATDDEGLEWVRKGVRAHEFLPLYLGWVAAFGIRPDGTVVRWNHDDNPDDAHNVAPQPEAEQYWCRMALAEGAKKYPVLAQLVPERPDNAFPCGTCGGTGDFRKAEGKKTDLICQCGGLGWLLDGEPPSNSPG